MKEKDRELLKLRQKTLALNDKLSPIVQLSWRIKKIKDVYSFETKDIEEMESFYEELMIIFEDYLSLVRSTGGQDGK